MLETEPETSAPTETPGLLRALGVLRERWWVVLVCALISLAAAIAYVSREPKLYEATAQLQFTTNPLASQVAGVAGGQTLDPEGEKNTNLQLVTTVPVAELVIKALKLDTPPTQLLEQVAATNPQNDYIVDITATEEDPQETARIANAFAQQYVVYSQKQNEEQLIKGEQLIDQKYNQLPPNDNADRENLRGAYQKLLVLQAVQTGNARVANTAATPGSPSSPKKKATAVVALIFGILLGIGLAFLFNMFDRRVKSWEELEELYGLSALASIPPLTRKLRTATDREAALEPFRILHNSVSVFSPSRESRTVLVTSAVPGEGKTTVALGLARAAALSGLEVILVEADFRRPTLQQQLRVGDDSTLLGAQLLPGDNPRGLGSALRSGTDPAELLYTPIPDLRNLRVLFGGPVHIDGLAASSAGNLSAAFSSLAARADLVVIDSAPLLAVVDTRVLLDRVHIDACLLIARVGVATRQETRRTRAIFERREEPEIGLVINALSEVSNDSYYGYGIAESGQSEEVASVPAFGGSSLSRPDATQRPPGYSQDANGAGNGTSTHLSRLY